MIDAAGTREADLFAGAYVLMGRKMAYRRS